MYLFSFLSYQNSCKLVFQNFQAPVIFNCILSYPMLSPTSIHNTLYAFTFDSLNSPIPKFFSSLFDRFSDPLFHTHSRAFLPRFLSFSPFQATSNSSQVHEVNFRYFRPFWQNFFTNAHLVLPFHHNISAIITSSFFFRVYSFKTLLDCAWPQNWILSSRSNAISTLLNTSLVVLQ